MGTWRTAPAVDLLCAVMHRVRQLDCLSSETGSSPVQRAIPECSAAPKRSSFGTKGSLVQIQPLRPFSARIEESRAHSLHGVSTGVRLGLINRGSGLL